MAYYAALTSLLQTLYQIPQPSQHITYLQGRCEVLCRLLLTLEDSPLKSSSTIKVLEGRIRDASYEAEDIIQSQMSREVLSKSPSRGVMSCFSRKMIRSVEYMPQNVELEFRGIEKIIDEFDSILDDLSNKINDGRVEDLQPVNSLPVGSSRFVAGDKSTPVGLDEDLLKIKDRLTGSPSKLDIISIIGMGGIGKTTLARSLCNDSLIQQHFDTRCWIVVSQQYHLREMFTGLLDSTRHGGGELHCKSIQQLAELLYKSLKGRRYLIVMDDVWDTKVWDDVRRFFPDDNNGSRIVLTTRLSEVAIYASSYGLIHHMNLLSSKESWNLLCEKLFGKERCPLELEEIGKKIAKNCKGLPLAITVISGLLSKGIRRPSYWNYIAENVKSAISGNDDQFMEILSLSYNSLPHHLKACFLYIGVFPEDYKILIFDLIKLWIAEGFVKPDAYKSLEKVAQDYLKDLIDRSLVMVDQRDYNGEVTTCVIHDMWRDFCVKKAHDEKFLLIMNSDICHFPQGINSQRRVSIVSNILDSIPDVHDSSIRSLLSFNFGIDSRQILDKFLSVVMSCRLLRVLNAPTIRLWEFPIEIVELVHLRYLCLSFRNEIKLPASISKLRNLHTLDLYVMGISMTVYLPSSIWEMAQLRHLLLTKSFLPAKIKGTNRIALENLHTLSVIENLKCSKEDLEMMPNLKKLEILYTKLSIYELNNLVYLHQLESLECRFTSLFGQNFAINFAFPPSLINLTLIGCRISWEKLTVVGSLPNLEVLELKDDACVGNVWEPNEGEFSKLKVLHIFLSPLKHWMVNNTHFPHLQQLILGFCYNLVEIPSEIGEIPTLEMLELYGCNPSAVESAKLIQEEQQSLENNTLRVLL